MERLRDTLISGNRAASRMTLPGPERREEAFVVTISADELVRFHVTVFSRPGSPLVRFSGPIGRTMQRVGTRGYLRASLRSSKGTSR
jgi:uncharacterized protein (UPF0548 family)